MTSNTIGRRARVMVDGVRITPLGSGWAEADWINMDGEADFYRFPASARLTRPAIIIAHWLESRHIGSHFRAKWLHRDLFHYGISRGAIQTALARLADAGAIRLSDTRRGRNSEWVRARLLGSSGR